MTTALAFDGREHLPPFFPFFRKEDTTWGQLVRACYPNGLFGYLPRALHHSPPEARKNASTQMVAQEEVNAQFIVQLVVANLQLPEALEDPAARLRQVGDSLKALAHFNAAEFRRRIEDFRIAFQLGQLTVLRAALAERNLPTFYRKRIEAYCAENEASLLIRPCLASSRQIDVLGLEKAERQTQDWLNQYGELLIQWPEIHKAAAEIRATRDRNSVHSQNIY